jgi:arabinoxylan arabinofuranohydrolase
MGITIKNRSLIKEYLIIEGRKKMLQTRKSLLLIVVLCLGLFIGSYCYADYPLLKTDTYSADPSCLEYNGVLYSYWSNDDNNNGSYSMHQITCHSTTDLKNWTNHGPVFDVPRDCSWAQNSWAPSVVYRNGYFWMYFGNGGGGIGVAKSTSPTGPFKDAKGSAIVTPSMPNCNVQWCFDPGVFVDDNGRAYMFFGGGGPGNCRAIEIGSDMISTIGTAVTIDAPYFFEASWIHKYNGKYYLSYSSDFSRGAATIEYMMSSSPMSGYVHKGTVLPNPPSNSGNNNHHSIFQYRGNWYIGYHNRYLASQRGIDTTYKRNAAMDQLFYNADGTMKLVTCTQNGLPLLTPSGTTPTPVVPTPTPAAPTPTPGPRSAFSQIEAESFNTQSGIQTESCGEGGQNIGFIENGDYIVFNNIDFGTGATGFQARVASSTSGGNIEIRLNSATGTLVGTCSVAGTGGWQTWTTSTCNVSGASGTQILYLRFTGGSGYLLNLNWFKFTSGGVTPNPTTTPLPTPVLTPTPIRTPTAVRTATPVVTPTPSPTPGTPGAIKVQFFNQSKTDPSGQLYLNFQLVNTGSNAVSLSNVKMRYWYTADGTQAQSFWCDYSPVGSSNVIGTFVKLSTAKTGADTYVEIGFSSGAGSLNPGASTQVQCRCAKSDWSNYTQSNDYSFNSSASSYVDWSKVTGYVSGVLAWGAEP